MIATDSHYAFVTEFNLAEIQLIVCLDLNESAGGQGIASIPEFKKCPFLAKNGCGYLNGCLQRPDLCRGSGEIDSIGQVGGQILIIGLLIR